MTSWNCRDSMTLLWLHSSLYWSQLVYSYCHWVPLQWEIPLFLTFNLLRLQLKACNITARLKLIDTIFAFTYILYVPPHDSVIHHKPLTSLPSLFSFKKNSRQHQESSFSIRYTENKQDGLKINILTLFFLIPAIKLALRNWHWITAFFQFLI